MNKSILASAIFTALLSGCGSSSGDSDDPILPVTYEWQIVQLISVAEEGLSEGCVIYDDSSIDDDVITAYIAQSGFNILYHNPDGSIAETTRSSNISNGLFTIYASDVPDNGYVTLEEFSSGRGSTFTGSYMFSVQKSLLSDMVLNISEEQTSDCYPGDDYREVFPNNEEVVKVRSEYSSTEPDYYQSSYDQDTITGGIQASYVPVYFPSDSVRDILITGFYYGDSKNEELQGDLLSWVFVDSDSVVNPNSLEFDSAPTSLLTSGGFTSVSYNTESDVTTFLNSDSGIIALHDNNSYLWHPIYDESDSFNIAYESTEITDWSAYLSGDYNEVDWSFNSFIALNNSDSEFSLQAPALSEISGSILYEESCVIDTTSICLNVGGYDSGEFTYQRTHIRLTEIDDDGDGDENVLFQSIYSDATEGPVVVLETAYFDFIAPTLDRVELNLMVSDANSIDAIQYLMVQNIDLVTVGEYGKDTSNEEAEIAFYNDINGFIATDTESDSLYRSMVKSTTQIFRNSEEVESNVLLRRRQ